MHSARTKTKEIYINQTLVFLAGSSVAINSSTKVMISTGAESPFLGRELVSDFTTIQVIIVNSKLNRQPLG